MRYFIIVALLVLGGCVSQPLPDGFKSSDDINTVDAAKTRISLGLTYLKNGNYSQAKFNLDKALQFAPRLADAHYSMAYYYQVVGENEMAEEAYQDALDLAPRNPDIANTYGAFLCQQGKYSKAKEYFLKAVNSNNYVSTAETYENLALCSQSQGQISDAIDYLQLAINHQPSRGKSLLLLTQLLASEERWSEAETALKRYEKTSRVNAETLWLSYKIQLALGNTDIANGYGDMLVRMFPDHGNAKQYLLKRYRKEPRAPQPPLVAEKPQLSLSPDVAPETDIVEEDSVAMPATETLPEKLVNQGVPEVIAEETGPEDALAGEDIESNAPVQPVDDSVQVVEETEDKLVITEEPSSIETSPVPDAPVDGLSENAEQEPETDKISEQTETIIEEPVSLSEEDEVTHHIVQRGENLYRISLQYNVKLKRLIEWNQLQDASSIYVGKKLVVVDPTTIE